MFDIFSVRILKTEEEYEAALKAIRPYFDEEPEPGSDKADRFEALALLISHYEDRHYPIPDAPPLQVLKHMMEANQHTQADLAALLGSRSRASEILNGKRDLTLENIRLLRREWHIPADALIGDMAHA